jgi:hypothetical protein
LPWLRLNAERVLSNVRFDVISPNMFAGSIIDLQPDTSYEVQATISDPDGVSGQAQKVVTVRTRAEPMPYAGGRVFHVYPHGTPNSVKIQPAFEGLLAAYNNSSSGTDMTMATRPRVRAGDTILVHAGSTNTSASTTRTRLRSARCRSTAPTISPAPAPPTSRSRSRRPATAR